MGYVGGIAFFASSYPEEWKHLSEYKTEKEMREVLGPARCFGTMQSLKEGKAVEDYSDWAIEGRLASYSLTCRQYDNDQELYYEIKYYNRLVPIFGAWTVKSGVFPIEIPIEIETKKLVELWSKK